MRRTITALTFAAAALAASGALAENAAYEHRQRLAGLWEQQGTTQTAQETRSVTAASVQVNFTGNGERQRGAATLDHWSDNWRGGRAHPPAGR